MPNTREEERSQPADQSPGWGTRQWWTKGGDVEHQSSTTRLDAGDSKGQDTELPWISYMGVSF